VTADTPSERREPKFVTKLRAQREQHRDRRRVVRVLYALVGFTLLLAGVAMLVAPGPAFVVIPVGLAILSLEFRWAETMLEKSLEQADKAAQKAADTSRTQKILAAIATALAIAAVVAWAIWGDIPLLPV
jgi:uncharacterized protein (TIGR02611 family)